jgi:23S rRNA pseudouridine2605 synthase
LNQEQLQNARTALWRQNGQPLLTQDDAVTWLDEMGICLFLPRHAQLPAPAPSFVEACAGAPRAVPEPAAIDTATALVTRLVAEDRVIPLNLMGNLTEQPDFLAAPETLRWVASVRGDRNWKSAPGARTAPLVQRVWEALDRAPGRTEPEVREELGRELTEGAVMRALVELWMTLRVAPEYVAGEPTRWSLMRDRYPQGMASGANTAQTTALSALVSLYLYQAVAATSEEAEIFLSPLTARSRIREVLHGMLATRQFGTMPLGVQTLLYLEGTLPEFGEPETTPEPAVAAPEARPDRGLVRQNRQREPRREFNREPRRASRPPFRREQQPGREYGRGPKREGRPERGERREFRGGEKKQNRTGEKPQWPRRPKPEQGREQWRTFGKPGDKPWPKRGEFRGPRTEGQGGRKFGERRDREFRPARKEGGWQAPRRNEADDRQHQAGRPERPTVTRETRREYGSEKRGLRESRREFSPKGRERGPGRPDFRREGTGKPKFGANRGKPGGDRRPPRAGERQAREFRRPGAGSGKPARHFGKPGGQLGKPGKRFGKPFGKPGAKPFGKPAGRGEKSGPAREGRPWKNGPDKSNPKGPRSGKNRKEPEDKPE